MAKTKKRTKPQPEPKACMVDLERLTQSQISKLTGQPAIWFRDNAHIEGCNFDGTYDAPKVVRSIRQIYRPADLSDKMLEPILKYMQGDPNIVDRDDLVFAACKKIETVHGASGLAAIGKEVMAQAEKWADQNVEWISELLSITPEGIRKEAEKEKASACKKIDNEAARNIEDMDKYKANARGHYLNVCEACERFRMGRTWSKQPIPSGYAKSDVTFACPDCIKLAKQGKIVLTDH